MGCGPDIANKDSIGTNIICFGDSLTQGVGAGPGEDYPSLLAEALGIDVINAGVKGNTTEDALRRLEADVLSKDPRLVIIQFGGNDFMRQMSRKKTFANLDNMVRRIQEAGAMVVVVGTQSGLIGSASEKEYKRIAAERKAGYVSNILKGIWSKPSMKSDSVHPNAKGYRHITDRILKVVTPYLT